MANLGNTGQCYKMARLVALEANDNKVVHRLSCGHDYEATWESPEKALRVVGWSQHHIGKKQRCTECKV